MQTDQTDRSSTVRPENGAVLGYGGHRAREYSLLHAHIFWDALIGPSWEWRVTSPDWPFLRVVAGSDDHAGMVEIHALEDELSETGAVPAMVQLFIAPRVARYVAVQLLHAADEAEALTPSGWDAGTPRSPARADMGGEVRSSKAETR